jgi:hypothetical protein
VNPDRRPTVEQLMEHPWMAGVDFPRMLSRQLPAPFAPNRENFGAGPYDSMYLNPDGTRPEPLGEGMMGEGGMFLEDAY